MIPLRLLLDTNVVVAAALNPKGLSRSVLLLATTRPAQLFLSSAILAEYRAVLGRRELGIRRGLQLQLLDLMEDRGRLVCPSRTVQAASDPTDNKFLECADEARADYLITGNLRHSPKFWKATKIVAAGEFIELVGPHLIP
ncbi:MAG: putative toxin-antitoxin system toxin component, PIN family [Candidatus Acidiferrum sp.]